MNPKTKLHHRVLSLSKGLVKLTDSQRDWGLKNCLSHVAYRTKHKTNCLDCGHSWDTGNNTLLSSTILEAKVNCPACGVTLEVKNTKQRVFAQREFYSIIDQVEDFQVIRIFEIRSSHKVGQFLNSEFMEVVSQWILPNGKWEYVAKIRGGMGWYNDAFTGSLEIRNKESFEQKYNIYPAGIYPKMKINPIYIRNGFKKKWYNLTPFDVLSNLSNNKFETLFKAKQRYLLRAFVTGRKSTIETNWIAVKICMRNKYLLTKDNITTWLDYIDLLKYLGKDLRNGDYVCPQDLNLQHSTCVAKKRKIQQKVDELAKKAKADIEQPSYAAEKGKFFGLIFTDGELTVKVIEHVVDFIAEGDAHHHCVYTNEYYKKPDSLIFSASINEKLIETTELSLSRMSIVQSRGFRNKNTEYSDRIKSLINSNLNLIKKALNGGLKKRKEVILKQQHAA